MTNFVKSFFEKWNEFWFNADYAWNLRLFRLVLGFVLIGLYIGRTGDLNLFYTGQGLLPLQQVKESVPFENFFSIFFIFNAPSFVMGAHFLFLGCLLGLALGFCSPILSLIAWILHVSFINRNMWVCHGVDFISSFYLFYLSFGFIPKIGSRFFEYKKTLGSVCYRLCQLQLCIVYFYSGVEKFKGQSWWGGEALWLAFANPQIARFDLSFLAHFPMFFAIASYLTVLWETYFPILIWSKKLRPYILCGGILLHGGIFLTMKIPFFAILMVSSYILFIDKKDVRFDFVSRFFDRVLSFLDRFSVTQNRVSHRK